MNTLALGLQLFIAFGILNVWVLRPQLATAWRGGRARTLREEFREYGLPAWTMPAVGTVKLGLAALLIAGIAQPAITVPSALAMSALMAGAVAMHVKVGDPPVRALPAAIMLAASLTLAFAA